MHRFYIPPNPGAAGGLILRGEEAHHALHVLRVRRGDPVSVLDGAGTVYHSEVESCQRDLVMLTTTRQEQVPPPACSITLIQAVPKGKIIESIIQKATELGVGRIVPLLSERVVVKLDREEAVEKQLKWQGVAVEAIKQCGAAWLPKVDLPVTPQQLLARREQFDLALVGSLQNDALHPRGYFENFAQAHHRAPKSIAVWVGPEGDFSAAELEAIQSSGARPITMGRLVLRSETAAVFCLSILNYELQAWPK